MYYFKDIQTAFSTFAWSLFLLANTIDYGQPIMIAQKRKEAFKSFSVGQIILIILIVHNSQFTFATGGVAERVDEKEYKKKKYDQKEKIHRGRDHTQIQLKIQFDDKL